MNALLDYGSSSSSPENSDDTDEENECDEKNTSDEKRCKLPKPLENNLTTSVFSNPFVREEKAKAAILEKHVKMVPGKRDVQVINGKKICYSHRRGRCRFGHKCKYAHDTDIQKTFEETEAEKQFCLTSFEPFRFLFISADSACIETTGQCLTKLVGENLKMRKLKTVICEGAGSVALLPTPPLPPQVNTPTHGPTDDSVWEENPAKKRKRPGLSQGLIPGKKVLKIYHEQKFKDAINKKQL